MNVLLFPVDNHKRHNPDKAGDTANQPKKQSTIHDLMRINGKTSLYWAAQSLAQSNRVQSVRVICESQFHDEVRLELPNDSRFEMDDFGITELDQLESESGVKFLRSAEQIAKQRIKSPTLVVSCATPHWEGEIYDDIIRYFRDSSLDSALFHIQDKNVQSQLGEATLRPFPLLRRPIYVLPMAIVGPEFLLGFGHQMEKLAPELENFAREEERLAKRKGDKTPGFKQMFPLGFKIARTLGFGFVRHLLKRNLSPALIEKTVKRVFETRFEFVELSEAALALSLSNPTHHSKIEALLSSRFSS